MLLEWLQITPETNQYINFESRLFYMYDFNYLQLHVHSMFGRQRLQSFSFEVFSCPYSSSEKENTTEKKGNENCKQLITLIKTSLRDISRSRKKKEKKKHSSYEFNQPTKKSVSITRKGSAIKGAKSLLKLTLALEGA